MHPVLTSEQTAEIFRKAARLIEYKGWTQHDREGLSGLTLDVALCEATHGDAPRCIAHDEHTEECDEIYDRFLGYLLLTRQVHLPSWKTSAAEVLCHWNDEHLGVQRTKDEVIAALRAAAGFAKAEHKAGR